MEAAADVTGARGNSTRATPMMFAMPYIFPTVLHMLAAAGEATPDRVALRCADEQ